VEPDRPRGMPPLVSPDPLPGGLICRTVSGRLGDGREVVVQHCPSPAEVEAEGLRAIAAAGAPAPAVLGIGRHVLVLEHVAGPPDRAGLGRAIARMHRTTADRYGWHRDNAAGLIPQRNGSCDDWPTFYVERRVRVYLRDRAVPPDLRRRLERAWGGPLPALLPRDPPASLTHGDLWAGNVVGGRWLIDPAVSYPDRELEVAVLEMSRTLPAAVREAYRREWPRAGSFAQRRGALQLHTLLVDVRHFGSASLPRVAAVLESYGW
jgi:fructosamine-3-kinase